jgi:hypothetical protein
MIRQVIGSAVLSQLVGTQQSRAKDELFKKMLTTLSLISTKRKALSAMLTKIIDQALLLANQMTGEQALFRCQLAKTGFSPLADVNTKVADETQEGAIFICTFPGFGRDIVDDGEEKTVWLVQANAELTSAFHRSSE